MDEGVSPARDLQTDLRDVRIFIQSAFKGPIWIELHRHYGSKPNEIAYVVVDVADTERRRLIRPGPRPPSGTWAMSSPLPGSDVYDVLPPRGEVSAHDVIRALVRFSELD